MRNLDAARRALIITLLVLGAGCATTKRSVSAEISEIAREDGSRITFVYAGPTEREGRHPAVLFLQGSSCTSVTTRLPYLQPFRAHGFAVLGYESRGVEPEDDGRRCSPEFLASNNRHQRLHDARAVLERARKLYPSWDGRLIVLGESEGAAIAPEVAAEAEGTMALVLLAGGGRTQAEDLLLLERRRYEEAGAAPEEIEAAVAQVVETFDRIRAAPTSAELWLGRTYQWWNSYLWYAPLEHLMRVQAPIFLAHGTRDASVPVESSDAIAAAFAEAGKSGLTYMRYEGLDHGWRDPEGNPRLTTLWRDLHGWLCRQVEGIACP